VYRFEQRIRKIFHLTAGQLLQKTRMEAAVGRLRESDESIASVALDCGYSDQSAFTRQFRQAVDCPRPNTGAPSGAPQLDRSGCILSMCAAPETAIE